MQIQYSFQAFYSQLLSVLRSRFAQMVILASILLFIALAIILGSHLGAHGHILTAVQPIGDHPMEGPVD
jgi:uncharacterized membrane protein